MPKEEVEQKATHMDDYLKEMVVDKYKKAIDLTINGNYEECFRAYMSLYYLIEPYNFTLKEKLATLTENLNEYLNQLKGQPLNKHEVIQINQKALSFKQLLQIYISAIPKAYAELGLWFKIVPTSNDWQMRLAEENFNSDYSSVQKKKDELSKLPVELVVKLMRPNAVHETYAKWRLENAV